MPKTRKGGVKQRTRRLNRLLYTSTLNPLLGVEFEYASDLEYEKYFAANSACKADVQLSANHQNLHVSDNDCPIYIPLPREESRTSYRVFRENQVCKLIPITESEPPHLPSLHLIAGLRKGDPRRAKLQERRAEVLHQYYDAATPAHWGTAEHPLELE